MKFHPVPMPFLRIAAMITFALYCVNASAATIVIEITDLAFNPSVAVAHPGDTIVWRNLDFIGHTATERGGQWDVLLPIGATRRLTLTQTGEMLYFCKFHPQMTGTIRVTDP